MSFRKNVFKEVGLYIESLGAGTWMRGGEDTDLIYRALRRHLKFVYSPTPLVYHDNWKTKEQAKTLEFGYILSSAAVFGMYTIKMDKIALFHILENGGILLKRVYSNMVNMDNKGGITQAIKGLMWFITGLIIGFKYVFVKPGKLEY